MLRVIKRLKEKSPLTIKATFLGAHTYPPEYRDNHQGYIYAISSPDAGATFCVILPERQIG